MGRRGTRVSPLARQMCIGILKFFFVTPFHILHALVTPQDTWQDVDDTQEDVFETEKELFDPNPLATCPEFMQIINIDKDTVVGIEKIVWCPDETAILRVLTQEEVSKPFKKRVYYWRTDRFIRLGPNKIYLK